MNSENGKTTNSQRLLLNISDKINLRKRDKYVASWNISIYYTWKNIRKSYKNNKFKISASKWNEEFELPDGSYSISDIQDYFEYIIEKHEAVTDNLSIMVYINKIGNRITFEIKTGYYLELLTPETMKLLGSTKSKITKDENGENVFHLEITEIVLIQCNIVHNVYQQDSKILCIFVPNKSFGQLLDISPQNFTFLETFNSEYSYIEVWFTDQISKPLEIKETINLTLAINENVKYKK